MEVCTVKLHQLCALSKWPTFTESEIRAAWDTGSRCEIFSRSANQWFSGEVVRVFTDEQGEWLVVRFVLGGEYASKQVQRQDDCVRPTPLSMSKQTNKQAKKQPNSSANTAMKKEYGSSESEENEEAKNSDELRNVLVMLMGVSKYDNCQNLAGVRTDMDKYKNLWCVTRLFVAAGSNVLSFFMFVRCTCIHITSRLCLGR